MKMKEEKKLYITIEDEDAIDGWPLDAVVPVVFSEYRRKIEAECYFGVYDEVRTYLLSHRGALFTRASLSDLNEALRPYLEAQGYARSTGLYRYYLSYVLWKKSDLLPADECLSSGMLTRGLKRKIKVNRTGFDLDELLSKKLESAVTVKDGELISIATVNEHSPGRKLLEAAVYTLPACRGAGYGKANASLLCRTLLEKKKGVVWCCSCRNRASIAIARSLGFRRESRFYAVDAYKTE